jgi:hypothetical protein
VTVCPPSLSPELREHNIRREQAQALLTGRDKQKLAIDAYWRGRKSKLTPAERKERNRAYQRERYLRLKAERGSTNR